MAMYKKSDISRIKLHLGRNYYKGYDNILQTLRLSVHGKPYKYDSEADAFFHIDYEHASASKVFYDLDNAFKMDIGDGKISEVQAPQKIRPYHVDKNTGREVDFEDDNTEVEIITKDGNKIKFHIADLYDFLEPDDKDIADHLVIKMHKLAASNPNNEIESASIKHLIASKDEKEILEGVMR